MTLLLLLFINNISIKNYSKKFNIVNKNNFNIKIINKYLILYISIYNCDGTCFASLIKRDAKLAPRVRVFICAFDT